MPNINLPNTMDDRVEVKILEKEMQDSYLKYAMSVIASRALPDVRDGLKPVHRRIIYVMNKMGLTPGSKYRKSAQIVGEVMGKYHPHGDASIYDSLVRMAQNFSLRYPLVDGQGNFGSVDGDKAAAHRYTEAKMAKASIYLVNDIDKDTVEFVDNYDGSQSEPSVLPSRIPNLLINGTSGIAVGMATNIPPHNLGEVCSALIALIDNSELTISELMEYIKGPDLPTGGTLYGFRDLLSAYTTGKGKATLRSKVEIGERDIIVTEIPYQVNKSVLVEKIADLIKEKIIEGVRDLRDESNKEGIRIVIECKKDASPEIIVNQLYKLTDLQINLQFNMLALINGGRQPKLLNLKEILVEFLNHRDDVVVKRTIHDKKQAESELHILDGLKIALDFIDEVIKLIRSSEDKHEAAVKLKTRFELSDLQVEAILNMRLQTLTNLDKSKIEDKRLGLLKLIESLNEILNNKDIKWRLIKSEIQEASDKLNSPRITEIKPELLGDYNKEDYIEDEEVLIQLTREQYLKVLPIDTFRQQGRGGRGVSGLNTKEEDSVRSSMIAHLHDYVYAFTNTGRVFKTRVFELPSGSRTGRGQNLINYFALQGNEKITNLLTLTKSEELAKDGYLIFATKNGIIKKTSIKEYNNVNKSGIIAIKLNDIDRLIEVAYSSKDTDSIILSADNGKTIIFHSQDVRAVGRNSIGVKGISVTTKEKVISLQVTDFQFLDESEEESSEEIKK